MGHYDSCYEADAKEEAIKKQEKIDEDLIKTIEGLLPSDRELLLFVAKNLHGLKETLKFLRKISKITKNKH